MPVARTPVATLIALHPLPTAGGMMDSHVLRKASYRLPALADLAVLRFNTRGTASEQGTSEGEFGDHRGGADRGVRAAQIWDLISELPDGLNTIVGDRGYRLSGGEKQRVALARLLLKAPAVMVLDEATAHLDSESEAAVQQALRAALTGRTSLVIAHRLSTIREADQILVIDAGRVPERGRHDDCSRPAGCTRTCTGLSSPARRPRPPVRPGTPPGGLKGEQLGVGAARS